MCTRVSRTPDKERGTKGREIRGNRSRDTSTGTPGLWGWPSSGSLDPQERPEIELSAIRRGFDLGYRVGRKFEGESDCPLIIYPRDEVENSGRTRSGILPGRRKQPSSRVVRRTGGVILNHLHCSYRWYCQPCVSGRTTIFAIHYECTQDLVREETGRISQEKIERFLSHMLEVSCTSVVKILFTLIIFILDLYI